MNTYRKKRNTKSKKTMRYKGGNKTNYERCEEIVESIQSAFSKYNHLPIDIECDIERNEEDRSKPYISFVIYKEGQFDSTKEKICFESMIFPFPNSTMISRYPTISIGNSCSIYVKPCSPELGVSTILKELAPILDKYNIYNIDVGDSTIFIYKNDTTGQLTDFATKYLYKLRYNRNFYCYYLSGPSNYRGIPMTALPEDIVWETAILPPRESIQNTSELGRILQSILAELCIEKIIDEEGLLTCVVSNNDWNTLLYIIELTKQIYDYVFAIVPHIELPKATGKRKTKSNETVRTRQSNRRAAHKTVV